MQIHDSNTSYTYRGHGERNPYACRVIWRLAGFESHTRDNSADATTDDACCGSHGSLGVLCNVIGLKCEYAGNTVLEKANPKERAKVPRTIDFTIGCDDHANSRHELVKSYQWPSDVVAIPKVARDVGHDGGEHIGWRR